MGEFKNLNLIHINTNVSQSSIYLNMFNSFNKFSSFESKLYYPTLYSNPITFDDENILVSQCLNRFDRLFFTNRNKRLYSDLNKLLNLKKIDYTIAYSLFSNGFLSYTLKKKHNISYIVIVQNTDVNLYLKKMVHLRSFGMKILLEAEKVVFISDTYKNTVINKYVNKKFRHIIENKSICIPFGIDDYWFKNKYDKKKTLDPNNIKLLYVGKINKNKNVLTTVNAVKFLLAKNYNVTLTLVGEFEDNNLKRKLGKYNFVKYIPHKNKEKLKMIYRENDIFIMPSLKESFGLVYGEAMSQGLPVIYTEGQGFDQQFKNGLIGYKVNPKNITDIVNSIMCIIKNYDKLSKNCLEFVDKFQWSNVINVYQKIFKDKIVKSSNNISTRR